MTGSSALEKQWILGKTFTFGVGHCVFELLQKVEKGSTIFLAVEWHIFEKERRTSACLHQHWSFVRQFGEQFYIFKCFPYRNCSYEKRVGSQQKPRRSISSLGRRAKFCIMTICWMQFSFIVRWNTFLLSSITEFRQLEGIMRIHAKCTLMGETGEECYPVNRM